MIVGRVSRIMCVLALVPAVAGAQRGGMGGMGRGGRTPSIAHEDALQIPKIVNGVNLAVDNANAVGSFAAGVAGAGKYDNGSCKAG